MSFVRRFVSVLALAMIEQPLTNQMYRNMPEYRTESDHPGLRMIQFDFLLPLWSV
jgi:hypothetical protein